MEPLPVASLGGSEVVEERGDLRIALAQARAEQREAFATARLHQRTDEKPIDLTARLRVGVDSRSQRLDVGVAAPAHRGEATRAQEARHAAQVQDLFCGESRHRLDERLVFRILTDEVQRGQRSLLLAHRMIGEELG